MLAALLMLATTGHTTLALLGGNVLAVCVGSFWAVSPPPSRRLVVGRLDPSTVRPLGGCTGVSLPPHLDHSRTNDFGPGA